MIGDITYVRKQFTRFDQENYPECDNREFLEPVEIETSLSGKTTVWYGYQKLIERGPGHFEYKWVWPAEALPHMS